MKNQFKLMVALLAALILTACEVTAVDDSEPVPENRRYNYSYVDFCDVYSDGYTDCEDVGSGYINLYGIFEVGSSIQVDVWTMKASSTAYYTYKGSFSDSYGSYDYYESRENGDRLKVSRDEASYYSAYDDSFYFSFSGGSLSKARPKEK